MSIRSVLSDLKRLFVDGEPITGSALQAVIGVSIIVIALIPFLALVGQGLPEFRFLVQATPAQAEIEPTVRVATAGSVSLEITSVTESTPAVPVPKESELIVHSVQTGQTLIGILKAYCRDDYEVVARENGIDPNWIYANKTVLKFKNGCSSNAPSVFVHKRVSPRELVRDDGASSGKHISRTEATRAPITAPAVAVAASAPTFSASQPLARPLPTTIVVLRPAQVASAPVAAASEPARRIRVVSPPVASTVQCDSEEIAPKDLFFNERARRMQICFMKHHRLGKEVALKKAKNLLVAALPRPDTMSCKDAAKQGLNSWAECMRTHHDQALRSAATKHRHDENLLLAIAYVESQGNPFAVSVSWCLSIMQVLPSTAEKFGVDLQKIFDPHVNFDTGARVLRNYLDGARGDLSRGLASYNLGPGEVLDRMNSPEGFDPKTFEYTQKVMRVFHALRASKNRVASLGTGHARQVALQGVDSAQHQIKGLRTAPNGPVVTSTVTLRPVAAR